MLVVEVMPAPDSPTVSGVLLALLFTVRVPVFVAAVGVNLTVTVQVPLTASVVQLLVWLKAPVTATLETVAAVVPVLVTVTVWVAAEEPTRVLGKERLAGEAHRAGAAAGVDGDPPRARAARRRRERHVDGTGAIRRDRRAAVVGLGE